MEIIIFEVEYAVQIFLKFMFNIFHYESLNIYLQIII